MFVDAGQLGEDLTELIIGATEVANDRWAAGTDLLIATDREGAGIGRPAARVVKRHLPAGLGGTGNPDADDVVAAVITLFRYGLRQIRLYWQLRRETAARPASGPEDVEVGHPAADPLAGV